MGDGGIPARAQAKRMVVRGGRGLGGQAEGVDRRLRRCLGIVRSGASRLNRDRIVVGLLAVLETDPGHVVLAEETVCLRDDRPDLGKRRLSPSAGRLDVWTDDAPHIRH